MNFKQGNKSEELKKYQSQLGVSSDGVFGKNTDKAVRDFQSKNGLKVDGIIGANTIAKLNNVNNPQQAENNTPQAQNSPAKTQTSRDLVRERYEDNLKPINREDLVSDITTRFSDQIEDTNNRFNERISSVRENNAQLLKEEKGISRSSRANSGILGTLRGQSQETKVVDRRNSIEQDQIEEIENKRELALANFENNIQNLADKRIADKAAAQEKSTTDFINFIANEEKTNKENAALLLESQIRAGVDLESLDDEKVYSMAEQMGVSVEDLSTIYQGKKVTFEAEKRIRDLETEIKENSLLKMQLDNQKSVILNKPVSDSQIQTEKQKSTDAANRNIINRFSVRNEELNWIIESDSELQSSSGFINTIFSPKVSDAVTGGNVELWRSRVKKVLAQKTLDQLKQLKEETGAVGQTTEREWPRYQDASTALFDLMETKDRFAESGELIDSTKTGVFDKGKEEDIRKLFKQMASVQMKVEMAKILGNEYFLNEVDKLDVLDGKDFEKIKQYYDEARRQYTSVINPEEEKELDNIFNEN